MLNFTASACPETSLSSLERVLIELSWHKASTATFCLIHTDGKHTKVSQLDSPEAASRLGSLCQSPTLGRLS